MDRITVIQQYADQVIQRMEAEEDRKEAYLHTYGVAQYCFLLAGKRGLNSELAYISGLLHDLYTFHTGSYLCHASSGAEMARPAIRNMNIFDKDEKMILLSAIYHHSDKELIHGEYDEVLKDADVLQRYLSHSCFLLSEPAIRRLNRLLDELHIPSDPVEFVHQQESSPQKAFKKSVFADLAEELAAKNICGEKGYALFMDIIKYYPEAAAFDELKNAWCAAFVYHCALKAGLELPMKQPPFRYRFAGVGTWYEWGKANGFCFYEKDGFVPERGDIVIYNNIIPLETKQKNSPWHDHIGIVLRCEDEFLVVAEGNIDNRNVSGIINRKRDDTIGCFVRIPEDYIEDLWKGDYMEYLNTVNL